MADSPTLTSLYREGLAAAQVAPTADRYVARFDDARGADAAARKADYAALVNEYYDLVTDFYEFGWGQSFHFAPRHKRETLEASIARHEFYLALRLGLRPGTRALDVGCGVGGPMRSIARFSGAAVVGVNNNAYQIDRGTRQNREAGLADRCSFLKADFMNLPVEPGSFDAAYAIEATCHAPDKRGVFSQVWKALKPGGLFAGYEWCVTPRYRRDDPVERAIIHDIEEGDGLPELATYAEVDNGLRAAGFELLETADLAAASDPETPWYLALDGQFSLTGFQRTIVGRVVTHQMVRVLEAIKVAPAGSCAVSQFLNKAGDALVKGGKLGIFTPMYFFLARKPA